MGGVVDFRGGEGWRGFPAFFFFFFNPPFYLCTLYGYLVSQIFRKVKGPIDPSIDE